MVVNLDGSADMRGAGKGSFDVDDSAGRRELLGLVENGRLKGVIFDLDGTLIHSGVPFGPYRDRLGIEGDVIAGIARLPSNAREEKWSIIAEYERELEAHARPAPWVRELLGHLRERGMHIGVITRSSGEYARRMLRKHCLDVDLALGREDIRPKPDPDGLHYLLEQFRILPENAVMVGDFLWDVLAGKNAGMLTVLVVLEHSLPYVDRADVVVHSLGELDQLLTP